MTWVSKLDLKGPPGHTTQVNYFFGNSTINLPSGAQTNIFASLAEAEYEHYSITDEGITVNQFTGVIFFRWYIGVTFNGSNADLVIVKNGTNVWYDQAENGGVQGTLPMSGVYPIWVQPGDSIEVKVRPFGASATGSWNMELRPLVELSDVG